MQDSMDLTPGRSSGVLSLCLLAVAVSGSLAWDMTSAADNAELISVGIDGQAGSGSAYYVPSEIRAEAVSAEGRFVVFSSLAENLIEPGECDTSSWNVYLRDREDDSTSMLTCIPNMFSGAVTECQAAITPDGSAVTFVSTNGNLVADDTNGSADIFVHTDEGLERVSVASDGTQGSGCPCGWPDSCNCAYDTFSSHPSISADGRYVAFASYAEEFYPGDQPDTLDVFLHDRDLATTEIISISPDGALANGESWEPSISADGEYVAFVSRASNLGVEDNNGQPDIYLWERQTKTIQRVSVASDGGEANGFSAEPVIDAEAMYVAFASGATNLVDSDQNGTTDVFVHDVTSGETINLSGNLQNGGRRPAISDDGNIVSFTSGGDDIYQAELGGTGATRLVVTNMQYSALNTTGDAIVVSGYNSLVAEDKNGDKDVYLLSAGGEDPLDDEICDDGIDNDADGLVDCADRLDCRKDPACKSGGGGGGGRNR